MCSDAVKTLKKSVNYRRSSISPNPGRNLQQLLDSVLDKIKLPAERYEPLNPLSTELRFIGATKKIKNCTCGYLSTFERGAVQPVVADDPNADALRIGSIPPPIAEEGKPQEQYIPGLLYFVVFKDHVVIAQNSSVRANAFEYHLNWLFKSKTDTLASTDMFALSDEAQKATKQKITESHIKAISFGQPLMEPVTQKDIQSDSPQAPKGKKAATQFRPGGAMLDLIKNIFSGSDGFEKLGLDQIYDGNLEIWIEVRYPKRSRSRPESSVKLMDTLGVALRDIEGEHVSLELANGHKVKGSELKISGSVKATERNDKLPDENSLYEAMVNWLKLQIDSGVVDP